MKTIYSYSERRGHQVFVNLQADTPGRNRLDFSIYSFQFVEQVNEWYCDIFKTFYNASNLKVE